MSVVGVSKVFLLILEMKKQNTFALWLTNMVHTSMFDHNHHKTILDILNALDVELLTRCNVYFGDGTLLAMLYGEYRWSQDIDFMCPVQAGGYRILRESIFDNGYKSLFPGNTLFQFRRDIQTDLYGVRFPINYLGHSIKLEIVADERIQFDAPVFYDWCPVPCLSTVDCFAEKLLANVDRGKDRSILSRDIIDLAFLRLNIGEIPDAAFEKTKNVYGRAVSKALLSSVEDFQKDSPYRKTCVEALQINHNHHIALIDGLDLLAADLGLAPTKRTVHEDRDDLF